MKQNTDPFMLSVSGIRGIVGTTMTPDVAARFAAAAGFEFQSQSAHDSTPTIVVGRDSRPSGATLEEAVVSTLRRIGCDVVTLGIVPTPTVGIMIDKLGAQGGLVITASHNPGAWNGVKALDASGAAPPAAITQRINERFQSNDALMPARPVKGRLRADDSAIRVHVNRILGLIDVDRVRAARFRVVVDSVNGAGGAAARALMDGLGVEFVHLNDAPTGRFPHEPEPTRENLTDLCAAVRAHHGQIGFAQDPDADRLAVIDEEGRYIGEEYTLPLAARSLLEQVPPQRLATVCLATNLSTSQMIDDVARNYNVAVHRSKVGEANVVEAMRRHECELGGEGNGGVIWPRVGWVRDSLCGIALILDLVARQRRPLSAIIAEMPAYSMEKTSVKLKSTDQAVAVVDAVARHYEGALQDRRDGIRVSFADARAWLHVRPSNTEPILRIIAEAPTGSAARRLIEEALSIANPSLDS